MPEQVFRNDNRHEMLMTECYFNIFAIASWPFFIAHFSAV